MTRNLLGTLTRAGVTTVRHPIASGSYAFGFAKGLVGALVSIARPGSETADATRADDTVDPVIVTPPGDTAPPVEPHPTPTPGPEPTPEPTPGPDPAPPLPPDPMPDPVTPPPPGGAEGPGEPVVHEPHATSRASAHGGTSADAEVDDWQQEAEAATGPDVEVKTPVGTVGAGVATNPDTTDHDLQQPGTEPLMDPSTTKAVSREAETLGKAADPEKE